MIIILEGPDGAGKTTLAQRLIDGAYSQAKIIHHRAYLGYIECQLYEAYLHSILRAPVILDRSWISEPIYANAVRKSPSRLTSASVQYLEEIARSLDAIVVNCRPPLEECLKKADDYVDHVQLKKVYNDYDVLATTLPVIHYNWTQGESAYDELLTNLREVRARLYQDL